MTYSKQTQKPSPKTTLAAIQEAILGGADPTQILEATAAGGGLGSANAGFVTIDYNYTETHPSTFFETAGLAKQTVDEDREEFRAITPFIRWSINQ